jgi:hypothetical protein
MYKIDEWPWDLIICLLNVLKYDLGDVDEEIFHDVERPLQRIFYFVRFQKKGFGRNCESNVLNRQIALRTHNLPSGRLRNVDETMFQDVERPCDNIFCILWIEEATWTNTLKWCFK